MSKTKHLDTAIAILRGTAGSKRAPRAAQAEIVVYVFAGWYQVLVNGKEIATPSGDRAAAEQDAKQRAEAIRKLGKTVTVTVY